MYGEALVSEVGSVRVLIDSAIALVNFPLGVILLFGSFWYNSPGTVGESWEKRWSYLFGFSSGLCGGLGSLIAVAAVSGETTDVVLRLIGIAFFMACALTGWWQVRISRKLRRGDWDISRRWQLEKERDVRRELRTVSRQGHLSVVVALMSAIVLALG